MKTKLCRPILIECKESILHLSHSKLIDSIEITGENDLYKSTPQQLILISLEDEKIKVGDLVLTTISELEIYNRIETFENRCDSIYCKKVVATQDQLSPELIQQLIAEYNNSCMQDFEIEMEEDKSNLCDCYYTKHCKSTQLAPGVKCRDIKHYKPKLNNGFVCIVKKEPITYTKKEVKQLFIDRAKEFSPASKVFGDFLLKQDLDWFERNKKK